MRQCPAIRRARRGDGHSSYSANARINLWTFELPGLRQRQEDIEPNLDYELERHAALTGDSVRFNTEARRAWLSFATSPQAAWRGNFRELSASVTRMATLADNGRITVETVDDEIARLRYSWNDHRPSATRWRRSRTVPAINWKSLLTCWSLPKG